MNNIKSKKIGIILIILSSLFFSLMAISVKSANEFPLIQKVFFRNFIGLIILSIFAIKNKSILKVNNKKLMFGRCIIGLTGIFLYYKSISLLNLSEAVVINKLSPFFVIIFAALFLKEKIKIYQIISIIIALIGIIILLKPQMNINIIPASVGMFGALAAGLAYTIIRQLRLYDSPITIVFYFCLSSTLITFPFLINQFVFPTITEFLKLSLIGVFALIAQLFMTNAYRYAPASQLSIYSYFNIIFSTIFGILLWNEPLTLSFLFGTILIISAGFINYYITNTK